MCIYLGQNSNITYTTQEHVIPAALGCCTKLSKGIVSDEANKYFSTIERDVIEHSLIQVPRIINGPGKRGKLSAKYAATSEVSPMNQNGRNCLGYMKGTEGYILSQFIIDEKNNIQFHWQPDDSHDAQNEIEKLKERIVSMGEKYMPVEMPQDDSCIYITYFKDKMHIGFHDLLSDEKIIEIKNLFVGNITKGEQKGEQNTFCGQLLITINIMNNLKNLFIVAAKSAINTLAYLKGAEYITQTTELDDIIKQVMSDSDEVFNSVKGIEFDGVKKMRQSLNLNNEQQACIIIEEMKRLKAWVFFYDHGFEVLLCDNLKLPSCVFMDGIVCDWKKRKDYRYLDYLTEIGVLSKS